MTASVALCSRTAVVFLLRRFERLASMLGLQRVSGECAGERGARGGGARGGRKGRDGSQKKWSDLAHFFLCFLKIKRETLNGTTWFPTFPTSVAHV